MTMQALEALPEAWKFTAQRLYGGGKDRWGDPIPESAEDVPGCLLAPALSEDSEGDFSAFVTSEAILYAPLSATFTSTDRVRTPAESPLPGTWNVNGNPVRWPAGWAVPLLREGT
jgi:hypothetical protein